MATSDQATPRSHAAEPGSSDDLFTFWPRHQKAIYQALNDRHTYAEAFVDSDDPRSGRGGDTSRDSLAFPAYPCVSPSSPPPSSGGCP